MSRRQFFNRGIVTFFGLGLSGPRSVGKRGFPETVRLPGDMWNLGLRVTDRLGGSRGVPTAVELDPRAVYPDVDRANNRWPR